MKNKGVTLIELSITLSIAMVQSGIAHGEVYKCIQADGSIVYSQTICADVKPMNLNVHRPTEEERLTNDLRIAEEKYNLAIERERRYHLWLSGKYLGGHNTYTYTYTVDNPGYHRWYPPEHHDWPRPPPPRQSEKIKAGSPATISRGR